MGGAPGISSLDGCWVSLEVSDCGFNLGMLGVRRGFLRLRRHTLSSHHNIDLRHPNFDQDHLDQGLLISLHLLQLVYRAVFGPNGGKRTGFPQLFLGFFLLICATNSLQTMIHWLAHSISGLSLSTLLDLSDSDCQIFDMLISAVLA